MKLRLSQFVHLVPIAEDRVLIVDAISHVRLIVDQAVADFLRQFTTPHIVSANSSATDVIAVMTERGVLTSESPEEELAHVTDVLKPFHGRDPFELLDRFRRATKEGGDPYWAVGAPLGMKDFENAGQRIDLILLGDCDVQMELDFLRREAGMRGMDLRIAASFADDLQFAGDHKHDAILIGALRSRHTLMEAFDGTPHAIYLAEARKIVTGLREHTTAPILIDNLPEPTVQPLGLAERGRNGHRNRFRAANLALAELVEEFPDVHIVDTAASLGAIGAERMLDDGQFEFTHLGSPGWLLQRPDEEKAMVHGIFPDMTPLAQCLDGNPYGREAVMARAHVDALMTVLGIDRKKCVIVDLDGVLWPGVLAETGSPFAWHPETGSPHSFPSLFFGLHEALKCLTKRGILLACVSKNDEATVRELWKYGDHYHFRELLLTPDDFVTWRVNWNDKVENIVAIAEELGLARESFLFIDDSPVERDRVRMRLPEVEVWGEDLFGLRRRLLNDPRLQVPHLTEEAAKRNKLVKAQLGRQSARAAASSESDFIASLKVETHIERLVSGVALERVSELFQRTTQFNATGAKFSGAELAALGAQSNARIYAACVKDRLGDHGLVGAAVIKDGEILGFAVSCRVLGLGVERRLLEHIIAEISGPLVARIIPTSRNHPVRNLYRDNGFSLDGDLWRLQASLRCSSGVDRSPNDALTG